MIDVVMEVGRPAFEKMQAEMPNCPADRWPRVRLAGVPRVGDTIVFNEWHFDVSKVMWVDGSEEVSVVVR